jgi:hypothetical protein
MDYVRITTAGINLSDAHLAQGEEKEYWLEKISLCIYKGERQETCHRTKEIQRRSTPVLFVTNTNQMFRSERNSIRTLESS